LSILDIEYAIVGNSDTVSVPAEILNDTICGFEWRLTVNDPLFVIAGAKEVEELYLVGEIALFSEEQ